MKFLFQLPPGSYPPVVRSQKKRCQGIWPAQFLPISGVKKKFLACKIIIYTDNTKVQEGERLLSSVSSHPWSTSEGEGDVQKEASGRIGCHGWKCVEILRDMFIKWKMLQMYIFFCMQRNIGIFAMLSNYFCLSIVRKAICMEKIFGRELAIAKETILHIRRWKSISVVSIRFASE